MMKKLGGFIILLGAASVIFGAFIVSEGGINGYIHSIISYLVEGFFFVLGAVFLILGGRFLASGSQKPAPPYGIHQSGPTADRCGAAAPKQAICPECGRRYPPDQIYCSACGARLSQ